MPKVLVVEDEPAAGRYLKALIEADPSGFSVVAVAGNGEEALVAVREHSPHIVFTDVRMPVLDGLGLAARLKDEFAKVPLVIVSGHQEFEYARQALALGVVDYLLKPVDPKVLATLLAHWRQQIQSQDDAQILELLGGLVTGKQAPGVEGPSRFHVALDRWGGPIARPSPAVAAGCTLAPGFWQLPGRGTGESLFLADALTIGRDVFEARVRQRTGPEGVSTRTLLFTEKSVAAADLAEAVRDLGPRLDRSLVPGQRRTHWGPAKDFPVLTLDPVWIQQVRLGLQESAYHRLEALIRGLVAEWTKEERPARQCALVLRQVFHLAQQEAPGDGLRDWEFQFDEGLEKVDGYGDLADQTWSLFAAVAGLGRSPSGVDAPEAHQRIRRFLQTHYSEPLSITMVCERFQLSQTSLSKLFRRFEGCTFHDYLTRLRLDAAEQLLTESPGLPLKTVASCVGYQDPFHFSRAFKAAKGRPPSRL